MRGKGMGGRIACVMFLLSFFSSAGVPLAADKVQLGLSWIPYGLFIGFYGAIGEGFYKAEGIDVEWHRGYGMADATKKVAAGSFEFVSADIPNAALGRARGMAVKSVALLLGSPPYAAFSLKEAGIRKPQDLEGRTLITAPKDILEQTFPIFARINGIKNWKWILVDPAAKNPSLLSGKGEAMTAFAISYPILKRMAAKVGKEVVMMKWSDHGFEGLGDAVLVREDLIAKSPDLVHRFVRATTKGYAYAFEHPDEASEFLTRHKPVVDPENTKAELLALKSITLTDATRKHGLGYTYLEKWERTKAAMVEAYKLPKAPETSLLYTTAFLLGP